MKILANVLLIFLINSHLAFSKWELINYLNAPSKETKTLINDKNLVFFHKDSNNLLHIKVKDKPDFNTLKSIKWKINSVCEYDDNYVVGSVTDVYFFKKNNFEFEKQAKLETLTFDVKQIDSNLCYYAANVSLCDKGTRSLIDIYNPKTNNVHQIEFTDYPNDIQMTLFAPRKLISISKNDVLISDVLNYNFNTFDLEGNHLYNFQRNDTNWIPINGKLTENYCQPNLLSILMKDEHFIDECSQIWLTNFVNDSTLLITWETPTKKNEGEVTYNFFHDIWIKEENKWKYKETMTEVSDAVPQRLDGSAIQLKWNYQFSNGYLYIIKPFPIDLVKKYFGKSYSEFENEMNNYYVENDLQYTCFIYKYVP